MKPLAYCLVILMVVVGICRGAEEDRAATTYGAPHILADQMVLRARQVMDKDRPRARQLLEQALQLHPDDTDLLRLCAEAATLAGDIGGYRDAMRRYLALEPRDDAAQLDLLLSFVRERQTLDQRAAAVDAILAEDRAESLGPPLRSRLASYLALAAHETGDAVSAANRLKQAIRYDPANPQAARLALELFADAPPASRAQLLLMQVQAQPFDPMPHVALGDLLVLMGQKDLADGQYAAARRLGGNFKPAAAEQAQPLVGAATVVAALKAIKPAIATPDPATVPPFSLSIEFAQQRYRYLDPIVALITLRNATDAPLALGESGAIPATVLIAATSAGKPLAPMIVDLRRRLRLDPRQAVIVAAPIHCGPAGMVLASAPFDAFDLTISAVLNPRISADGRVAAPPVGAMAIARSIQRTGSPTSETSIADWLRIVEEKPAAEPDTLRAVACLCHLNGNAQTDARIVPAITRFYQRGDRITKAWIACNMPEKGFDELRNLIVGETDPLIAICTARRGS